jgi:predicted kinase
MSKALTVTICKGLPASGKSTWAKNKASKSNGHTKRVNKDDLRAMLDGGKWSKSNEKYILKTRNSLIRSILIEGRNVIVDDTNLLEKHTSDIKQIAKEISTTINRDIAVGIMDFTDVDPIECIRRDNARANGVGHKVIMDMYNKYLKPKEEAVKPPKYNSELPDCIICDVDGTLADNSWRNPFDASEADKDKLIKSMAIILDMYYYDNDAKVILFSGRDESFRTPTTKFLEKYNVSYNRLYLRAANDTRKDSIVKREMYEEHIKNKYNVLCVFDDRNQVVDMWRKELGLPCHQVNYGDF